MMQPKHVDGLKSERRGYFQIFVDFADALLLHVNSFDRVKKSFHIQERIHNSSVQDSH